MGVHQSGFGYHKDEIIATPVFQLPHKPICNMGYCSLLVSIVSAAAVALLYLSDNTGIVCGPSGDRVCSKLSSLHLQPGGGKDGYWQHRFSQLHLIFVAVAMASHSILRLMVRRGIVLDIAGPGGMTHRNEAIDYSVRALSMPGACLAQALRDVGVRVYGFTIQLAVFCSTVHFLPGDNFIRFGADAVGYLLFGTQEADALPSHLILFPQVGFCPLENGSLLHACVISSNLYLPATYAALWFLMVINLVSLALELLWTLALCAYLPTGWLLRRIPLAAIVPSGSRRQNFTPARLAASITFPQLVVITIIREEVGLLVANQILSEVPFELPF